MPEFQNKTFNVFPAGGDNWERTFRTCLFMGGMTSSMGNKWCAKKNRWIKADKSECGGCNHFKPRNTP